MQQGDYQITNPDRYDVATEVLSSAFRVLQSVGFSEQEIARLFALVAEKRRVVRFGSIPFDVVLHKYPLRPIKQKIQATSRSCSAPQTPSQPPTAGAR